VIPHLLQFLERLGVHTLLAPLVVAGLFTIMVLLFESISRWFDDRNP